MSVKDLHVIRVLLIIILFWFGVWSLFDEIVNYIEKKYKMKRWRIHLGIILLTLFVIIVDPYTFEKL